MKLDQLDEAIGSISVQIANHATEIKGKIAELEAALAAQGEVPQDVLAALDVLNVQVSALDDIVPAVEPPAEPPVQPPLEPPVA